MAHAVLPVLIREFNWSGRLAIGEANGKRSLEFEALIERGVTFVDLRGDRVLDLDGEDVFSWPQNIARQDHRVVVERLVRLRAGEGRLNVENKAVWPSEICASDFMTVDKGDEATVCLRG